jgi:hypothetical protein
VDGEICRQESAEKERGYEVMGLMNNMVGRWKIYKAVLYMS